MDIANWEVQREKGYDYYRGFLCRTTFLNQTQGLNMGCAEGFNNCIVGVKFDMSSLSKSLMTGALPKRAALDLVNLSI
jgi:hypothetical protein